MHCFCLVTCHHFLSTSSPGCLLFSGRLSCCILLRHLHLASPFIALLPQVSILNPPPSFAPAGCCVASHHTATTSHPLINTASSQHAVTSWLMRCLSSCCHFQTSRISTSHCGIASCCPIASLASCPAGCKIASPQTTASHLPATLPLIAPSPLVMPLTMPLPLAPLVWLVVASPLLTPSPPICWRLRLLLCRLSCF
jgi:hypothetical protein